MGFYGTRVCHAIIVLFIVMIAGYIAKKTHIIREGGPKMLSALLAYITNPCLIIASLQIDRDTAMLVTAGKILIISMIAHGFLAVLTHFIFKPVKNPRDRSVYAFAMMYANCGFMGYPIMQAMFPAHGLFYGVMYTVPFNLFCWTHGVAVMNRSEGSKIDWKKVFLNPCLIAVVISMILFVSNLRFPAVVTEGIDMIGDMTFPISMLIIGSLLADLDLRSLFTNWRLYLFSVLKLLLLPALTLVLCKLGLAGVLGEELTLLLITMTAAPSATNTAVLSELYDNNAALAAKFVGITTLFSVVTMPMMLSFAEKVLGF